MSSPGGAVNAPYVSGLVHGLDSSASDLSLVDVSSFVEIFTVPLPRVLSVSMFLLKDSLWQ